MRRQGYSENVLVLVGISDVHNIQETGDITFFTNIFRVVAASLENSTWKITQEIREIHLLR